MKQSLKLQNEVKKWLIVKISRIILYPSLRKYKCNIFAS